MEEYLLGANKILKMKAILKGHKAAKKADISDMVESDSFHLEIMTKGMMYVQQCDFKPQTVLSSIRVWLSLKKDSTESIYDKCQQDFKGKVVDRS